MAARGMTVCRCDNGNGVSAEPERRRAVTPPVGQNSRQSVTLDTPTAQSGGILASSEVACCCRSYARSTSVLLPVCPTAKLKNGSHDASSGVQPFGIKARHQRTLVFDTLTPRISMQAHCTTENSEFEEGIVSKTRRCQIHPPAVSRGLSLAYL